MPANDDVPSDSLDPITLNANAGPDQTVCPGEKVTLDASESCDDEWAITSYYWNISAGTINLNLTDNADPNPTFVAPDKNGWVSFLLTVTNDIGETDTDTVHIEISSAPTAAAGPNQTVTEGDLVLLNGSLSSAPCNFISNYQWTQISGTDVLLNNSFEMEASFIAPFVDAVNTLSFQLTVENNLGESDIDTVNINVNKNGTNLPPIADANIDQSVIENAKVTLDASKSFDPDGTIKKYVWKQTVKNDDLVSLSENSAITPTFKAPEVNKSTLLTFSLTVQDNDGSIDTDDVNIFIEDDGDSNGGESCFISAINDL